MPATPRAPLGDVSNSPATASPASARKRRAAPIDASTGRTPIHAHPRSRAAIAPHGRRALCQMLSASPSPPSAAARGVAADLLGAGLRAAEWHSPVEEDVADLASVGASFRTSSPSVAASVSVASEASAVCDSPRTAGVKQDFLDGITSDGESESAGVREPALAPAPANESLSVEAQVWAQEQELAELMDELQPPEGCPPAPASQSLRRAFLETASSAAMPSPVMRGSNQPDTATEDGSGEGPSPTVGERSTRREAFLRKELKETWLTSGEKFIAERAVSSIEQMPERQRQRQQQEEERNEGNDEAAQMRYEDIMAKLDSAIAVAPDAASRDYLGQLHAQLTAFHQQIHDADAELEAAEGRFAAQGEELARAREAAAEAEGKCAALHLQLSEQMMAQKQTAQQQPEPASGSGSARGRSASAAGGGCCGSRPRRE